ncbi:MAG TPA: hypothetical protein VLR90_12440 [Blastocatellia bacterium]|nr:hypothetical protein [Blastocatellia bacterium]
MINRTAATLVICLLTFTMTFQQSVVANSNSEKDASLLQKVKAGIVKLGVGQSSRVSLKLKDKTKVAGYISEIGDDSFVVANLESGGRTTVAYPEVVQVKGNNLTTRTKVIIGVAIAAGIAITLYIVRGAFCDGC